MENLAAVPVILDPGPAGAKQCTVNYPAKSVKALCSIVLTISDIAHTGIW
jgi:hypothetical protein